jgi:ribonuclease R
MTMRYAPCRSRPGQSGRLRLWVAIADVAHYVRRAAALDREARARGNSTYFPDRVVPMLPEALSADLCSLHEGRTGPARRAHGDRRRWHASPPPLHRGLMRSAASLSYAQVQAARTAPDGRAALCRTGDRAALRRLCRALPGPRGARAARPRPARAAHRAGPRTGGHIGRLPRAVRRAPADRGVHDPGQCRRRRNAGGKRRPLLYRVHEEPPADKIDALREQWPRAPAWRWPRGRFCRPASSTGCWTRRRGTGGRGDQPVGPACHDPGLLQPREPRPFRPGAAPLRAFHLADPALCRPDRASRADRGAWLGR